MRIIHSLEGTSWSGGQAQAFFLAKRQAELGHEVLLMCQKDSALQKKAENAGISICPVDYFKEINPVSIYKLLKAYDEFCPDVVNVHRAWAHTQWVFVSLLRRFRGLIVTRRVLFKPDVNPISWVKYRTPIVKGYIAVSQAVSKRLQETGVNKDRIRVVYSATDTNRFNPDKEHLLKGDWPVANGAPAALLVGNYNKNKGHHLLIEAFDKISDKWPKLNLVIAGNMTADRPMQELAQKCKNKDRIHLLGFRTDVPALMNKSLFTINASYQEGFSGTVRESLSLGVPVVASDIPANLEMNSVIPLTIFESGNANDLARALLSMNRNFSDSLKKELRNNTIARFSVEAMVDDSLKAYEGFLKK